MSDGVAPARVLVVGGTGVFGGRLVRYRGWLIPADGSVSPGGA